MDFMGNDIKKVLITGATGFLGKTICEHFGKSNKDIIKVSSKNLDGYKKIDLLDLKTTSETFRKISPDLVIHCAANVPKNSIKTNSKKFLTNNIEMFKNLIFSTKCPIINMSSMTVYSENSSETYSECEKIVKTDSNYANAKLEIEKEFMKINRPGVSLRLPGLFGIKRKNGLIYNSIYNIKNFKKIKLPEDKILWSAMDVDDAAKSIVKLTDYDFKNHEIVNLGYEGPNSINRFVGNLNLLFNLKLDYEVKHPDFCFKLDRAEQLELKVKNTFLNAIQQISKKI